MGAFCAMCLRKFQEGKGGEVYDSDIIVNSVVTALLGVKFGGLLPLSVKI